jgi:hypothetical protein
VTEYSFLILSCFTHTGYNFVTKKIKITWAEAAIVLVFFLGFAVSWLERKLGCFGVWG